eukprot:2651046-Karenia_brevis.AAC.1
MGIESWSPNELIEIASGCKCNRLSMTEYTVSKPLQDAVLRSRKGSLLEKNLLRSYIKAKEALASLQEDLTEMKQSGAAIPIAASHDVTKKKGTKTISFERIDNDYGNGSGNDDSGIIEEETPSFALPGDAVDVNALLKAF